MQHSNAEFMNRQPQQHIAYFNKRIGETPLEALNRFRLEFPEFKNEVLSYAGRLDPLASGILPILIGKEGNKKENREKYLNLDKEYEIDVLFGIATDTGDILGKITHFQVKENVLKILENKSSLIFSQEKIEEILHSFIGTREQKYPLFSARTVAGKPLFEYARENSHKNIEIPSKSITIYDINFINISSISKIELKKQVLSNIALVSGDFRQKEILEIWENTLKNIDILDNFTVLTIRVFCSSGTYMRTLSEELGKQLGIAALTLRILRTKIQLKKD